MMNEKEIWRPIPGWDGYYEISNLGRILSCDRTIYFPKKLRLKSQIIKTWRDRKGYVLVTLRKDGGKRHRQVHRLVAQVYLDNPENKPQVNHEDSDKSNNSEGNLKWVTGKENAQHSLLNNTFGSKLNTDNVLKIKQLINSGTRLEDIHKEFDFVSISAIKKIKNNITWKCLAA